jgi:hypothetical protein
MSLFHDRGLAAFNRANLVPPDVAFLNRCFLSLFRECDAIFVVFLTLGLRDIRAALVSPKPLSHLRWPAGENFVSDGGLSLTAQSIAGPAHLLHTARRNRRSTQLTGRNDRKSENFP